MPDKIKKLEHFNLPHQGLTVKITYESGHIRTVKLARFIMEDKLGRPLSSREVVIHKDGNEQNFAVENLKIVNRTEYNRARGIRQPATTVEALMERINKSLAKKSAINKTVSVIKSNKLSVETLPFNCTYCDKLNHRSKYAVNTARNHGHNLFCNLRCSGKYQIAQNPDRKTPLMRWNAERTKAREAAAK
jgi:hypothetical protein